MSWTRGMTIAFMAMVFFATVLVAAIRDLATR